MEFLFEWHKVMHSSGILETPTIFNTSSCSRCSQILWTSTHIQNYANKCSSIRYDTLLAEIVRTEEDCAYSSSFSQVNHKLRNSTSARFKTSNLLQTIFLKSGTLCCALEVHHSTGLSSHSTTRLQLKNIITDHHKNTPKTLPCIWISLHSSLWTAEPSSLESAQNLTQTKGVLL